MVEDFLMVELDDSEGNLGPLLPVGSNTNRMGVFLSLS